MAHGSPPPDDLAQLMAELRPSLHRYCARMVGSAFEGEDVVQDALAKAAEAWPAAGVVERPQSWLFRIAHNTALDALRHRRRQAALAARLEPDAAPPGADARVAASASLAVLMQLPAAQRSCVVLVDVLGHSLEETIDILGVTAPGAKAALHRGRAKLQALAALVDPPAAVLDAESSQRLRAYADRFNARDFDALRALLAEDVRLDLVNRTRLAGRKEVSIYFTRYEQAAFNWRMAPGLAEGRPAILASDPADPTGAVRWVILLDWKDGKIAAIRDFHFADYVVEGLAVTRL
jgi:RNA polymerase sigma-70 factor (ECF subfamily)